MLDLGEDAEQYNRRGTYIGCNSHGMAGKKRKQLETTLVDGAVVRDP